MLSTSSTCIEEERLQLKEETALESVNIESLDDENIYESVMEAFDTERKIEKEFIENFTVALDARKKLMEKNLKVISNIVDYADHKSSSLWKHRTENKKSPDELNLFQTTVKAMARHLYLLENFRKAKVDRLTLKVINKSWQGLEAKAAVNRSVLKAVGKEAKLCKEREMKVARKYKLLKGNFEPGRGKLSGMFKRRGSHEDGDLSLQTWKETTERAKLLEAKHLRCDADSIVLSKFNELSKISMEEYHQLYLKYILVEMEFHAKALEELTAAYQCLQCPAKSFKETDAKSRMKKAAAAAGGGYENSEESAKLNSRSKSSGEALDLKKSLLHRIYTNNIPEPSPLSSISSESRP